MLNTKKSTPIQPTLSPSDITNSPPGLMLNTKDFLDSKCQRTSSHRNQLFLMHQTLLTQLTGEPKVQSMQLKIKDNADHAGHSLPLALLKDTISSKPEIFLTFLNNKSLIAIPNRMDVTEDGNHGP